jgi:hypothetical protein
VHWIEAEKRDSTCSARKKDVVIKGRSNEQAHCGINNIDKRQAEQSECYAKKRNIENLQVKRATKNAFNKKAHTLEKKANATNKQVTTDTDEVIQPSNYQTRNGMERCCRSASTSRKTNAATQSEKMGGSLLLAL